METSRILKYPIADLTERTKVIWDTRSISEIFEFMSTLNIDFLSRDRRHVNWSSFDLAPLNKALGWDRWEGVRTGKGALVLDIMDAKTRDRMKRMGKHWAEESEFQEVENRRERREMREVRRGKKEKDRRRRARDVAGDDTDSQVDTSVADPSAGLAVEAEASFLAEDDMVMGVQRGRQDFDGAATDPAVDTEASIPAKDNMMNVYHGRQDFAGIEHVDTYGGTFPFDEAKSDLQVQDATYLPWNPSDSELAGLLLDFNKNNEAPTIYNPTATEHEEVQANPPSDAMNNFNNDFFNPNTNTAFSDLGPVLNPSPVIVDANDNQVILNGGPGGVHVGVCLVFKNLAGEDIIYDVFGNIYKLERGTTTLPEIELDNPGSTHAIAGDSGTGVGLVKASRTAMGPSALALASDANVAGLSPASLAALDADMSLFIEMNRI